MGHERAVFALRPGRRAVSEVVGSVLLLLITVAAFAVLFVMVQGVPKPAPGVSSDFEASMEFTGPNTAQVELRHLGGSTLDDDSAAVVLTVGNNTTTYTVTDGLIGPGDALTVGGTWRLTVPLPVTNTTRVSISVVSYVSNELLYEATLQVGNQGGAGGHSPIITAAWSSSSAGVPSVYNNGMQTYRIHAIVVDPDGDLAESDPVTAKITVAPSGSLLSTNAIGAGSFALVRTEGSYYQTADLVMGASVLPGDYGIELTARDAQALEATALVPLEVVNGNIGGGPTLTVVGVSTSPSAVETNDQDVSVLRLDLSSAGETTSVSQLLLGKAGPLPDGQVTAALWLDSDASGTFSAGTDMQLTPSTAFTAGVANIFSAPILGVGVSSPQTVFVVVDFVGAEDGTNVSFFVSDGDDIRGTGVPSGATSSTAGTFPVTSNEVVVGSRLQVAPATGAPERILQNAAAVRLLGLSVRAAGEDFAWGGLNLTLVGTLPRSAAQVYVTVGGTVASSTTSFNAARVATVSLAGTLPEASGWVSLAVYVNLTGGLGETLGLQVTASGDLHATGQQSGTGRNGVSASGFPLSSGLVTVASAGNLSVDPFVDAALSNAPRAGMNNVYVMSLIIHSYGEPVDFNKLEVSRAGTLADGDFSALTMRVRGGPWFSGTFFSAKVTWDAGVTGKLFAVYPDASNKGEAVVDIYANLTAGTQGKDAYLNITSNSKVRGYGKTTLTSLNAQAESEPYALTSGQLKVAGDVYVTGFNIAPSWVLAPKSGVPVLKLTLRPMGENMTLQEVFWRSTLGPPPASSLTVRLYRDVNNDTTTSVGADDVQLVPSQAGAFGGDAAKAFTPSLSIPAGADTNIYFAVDVTAAGAGFSLQTQVNTSNMSFVGAWSGASVLPNAVAGGPNPPQLAQQSPAVPVYDRGGLTVGSVPLSPENHTHAENYYVHFLRIELTASSVEAVNVTSLTLHLNGNVTPARVRVDVWWDKDKNNITNVSDGDYGDAFFSTSDVTFSLSPAIAVAAGATEHVVVKLTVVAGATIGDTVGVQVTGPSSLSATGVTSGLPITPTGSFPRASLTLPIWP